MLHNLLTFPTYTLLMEPVPTTVHFVHVGFAALAHGRFRLTKDDRVAALAITMDNTDVVVPIRAVARLFDIAPGSPDGRMLHLIEQSLNFVAELRIGDELPTEVSTGEASWSPRDHHYRTAVAKLQLQLVNWIGGAATLDERVTGHMLVVSAEDPALRPRIQEALRKAATALDIAGGGSAVSALIEDLSRELAYVEALRDWLLDRARAMLKRLIQASQDVPALAAGRRETLFQVLRLASTAAADLADKFSEIDAQTAEIRSALRYIDKQKTFLRPHRDRLYCTLLTWDPLLTEWDKLPKTVAAEADGLWRLIDETYRFLAPRFMTVQQWQGVLAAPDKTERGKAALVW